MAVLQNLITAKIRVHSTMDENHCRVMQVSISHPGVPGHASTAQHSLISSDIMHCCTILHRGNIVQPFICLKHCQVIRGLLVESDQATVWDASESVQKAVVGQGPKQYCKVNETQPTSRQARPACMTLKHVSPEEFSLLGCFVCMP